MKESRGNCGRETNTFRSIKENDIRIKFCAGKENSVMC